MGSFFNPLKINKMYKITLNKEQKTAMRKMKLAAKRLHVAMNEVNRQWIVLENTDSPIGYMDTMYPFKEKFDTVVYDTELWAENIVNKVNETLTLFN